MRWCMIHPSYSIAAAVVLAAQAFAVTCKSYQYVDPQGNCQTVCPFGTRADGSSRTCIACQSGTYGGSLNGKSCTTCRSGTVSGTQARECNPCGEGTAANAEHTACVQCPAPKLHFVSGRRCVCAWVVSLYLMPGWHGTVCRPLVLRGLPSRYIRQIRLYLMYQVSDHRALIPTPFRLAASHAQMAKSPLPVKTAAWLVRLCRSCPALMFSAQPGTKTCTMCDYVLLAEPLRDSSPTQTTLAAMPVRRAPSPPATTTTATPAPLTPLPRRRDHTTASTVILCFRECGLDLPLLRSLADIFKGSIASDDHTGCVACPAGSITVTNADQCYPCPENTIPDPTDGGQCIDCPEGYTSPAGSATCTPPPPTVSQKSRRKRHVQDINSILGAMTCPKGQIACPLPGRANIATCMTPSDDLETCDLFASASCVMGECVLVCPEGWRMSGHGCQEVRAGNGTASD
ncbi:uncharacterized protein MKK02DRAFT_29044 [Dioszegia hungarica]|uniref:Tyrosine-protein kinase ephrin type A/B receptor-like domain-containing protein n=1 Tax=Dioszegia hungarica TaxID=4972 RepID=A0AA38LQD8_9TREE|nr:uncharacterized protein MKK02DRAFT_29044 [Dioszegia hungarica]KAI9633147.1 hypothetical protein MKK02DRAFT_29044 [Dioszegia hungarica]